MLLCKRLKNESLRDFIARATSQEIAIYDEALEQIKEKGRVKEETFKQILKTFQEEE